jgi:hypothetical protein
VVGECQELDAGLRGALDYLGWCQGAVRVR